MYLLYMSTVLVQWIYIKDYNPLEYVHPHHKVRKKSEWSRKKGNNLFGTRWGKLIPSATLSPYFIPPLSACRVFQALDSFFVLSISQFYELKNVISWLKVKIMTFHNFAYLNIDIGCGHLHQTIKWKFTAYASHAYFAKHVSELMLM